MKLLFMFLVVSYSFLIDAEIVPYNLKEVTPEMMEIQEKVNNLMMGHIESPTDWSIEDHEDLFQNAEVVSNFSEIYKDGLLPKNKQFNIRDPDIRDETISIFELLFYATDFDSIYTVASWLHSVMNYEQYTYALAVALIHRQDIIVKMPPWYEIFPNYFVDNKYLEEAKTSILDFDPEKDVGDEVILFTNTTYGPGFFAEDPSLANMFYNWQLEFPSWMDPAKYGLPDWKKQAELYFAYHYHIFTAFLINSYESMGDDFQKDWSNVSSWNWLNLKFDFGDGLVNSVGKPINQITVPASHVDPMVEAADKIFLPSDEIHKDESGMLARFAKASRVVKTATVFNLKGNMDKSFFGSYYDTLVNFLASYGSNSKKDGGNLAGYPMAALKDPQYYSALDKVLFPMITPDPDIKPPTMDGIKFVSVLVSDVKTKYRTYDMDISRYLNKDSPRGRYKVRQMVMDHSPFLVTLTIQNNGSEPQDIVVRLLAGPNANFNRTTPPWTIAMRIYSLYGIQMEIDRFFVKVPPGNHTIVRDLKNSPIFTNEGEDSIQCGVPNRLILPRGTKEGVKMMLIASMSSYKRPENEAATSHEEDYFRKSLLCGSGLLDDGFPIGHPYWDDGHSISHLLKNQEVLKEFTVGVVSEDD